MFVIIPASTIHDMKCGKYKSDCDTRLKPVLRSSLSISESIIGAGKPTAMLSIFSISVLRTIL